MKVAKLITYCFTVILSLSIYFSHRNLEGAGCVLVYRNTVIMLERNPNYPGNTRKAHELEYPGGKFEAAKDWLGLMDTARREVQEEVGLTLGRWQLLNSTYIDSKGSTGGIVRLYVVNLTNKQAIEAGLEFADKMKNFDSEEDPNMGIKWVDIMDVKSYVRDNNATALPNGLPMRKFNKILIDMLIKQGKL